MVQLKDHAPYTEDLEHKVLLNPLARTEADAHGSFSFPKKLPSSSTPSVKSGNAAIANKLVAAATAGVHGVGSDVEVSPRRSRRHARTHALPLQLISSVPSDNATFLERNFTDAEIAYCRAAPDFRASIAARWSAKEATVRSLLSLHLSVADNRFASQFKSLKVESKGAAAAMKDIEVVATPTGPTIVLHGEAKKVADAQGVKSFELSLSHSDDVVGLSRFSTSRLVTDALLISRLSPSLSQRPPSCPRSPSPD